MEEESRDLLIRIDENVKSMLKRIESIDSDLSTLKTDNATNKEKIKTNSSEIEKLRTENKTHNWINSIAAVLATILGVSIR